jgi:hypothetical protein
MSKEKPYRWYEEYGISKDEYYGELYAIYADALEELKRRCEHNGVPVRQYLMDILRQDRETSRLCGRRRNEPIPLMGFAYSGKTLFINFYKMWPHARQALLSGGLPPYPWRTQAVATADAEEPKQPQAESGTLTTSHPGQPNGMPVDAKYCFKRRGDTGYEVAFGSTERKLIPRLARKLPGLDYVHVLLRHEAGHHRTPNSVPDNMTSAEVVRTAAGVPPDHTESEKAQKVIDDRAWEEMQKRRDELNGIIENPGADPAEQLEAQEELHQLEKHLATDTYPGPDGRPKSKAFSDEKMRTHCAIRSAIDRAIEKIRTVDSDLADHLKDRIDHKNGGHKYKSDPRSRIDWDLE